VFLVKEKTVKTRILIFALASSLVMSSAASAFIPSGLLWPIPYPAYVRNLLGFGGNWIDSCGGLVKKHTGIDIQGMPGTPVYATYGGVVKVVGQSKTGSTSSFREF
jgi:murein DD-endopeptidase MepM/ murein hydrolase activator NlpD